MHLLCWLVYLLLLPVLFSSSLIIMRGGIRSLNYHKPHKCTTYFDDSIELDSERKMARVLVGAARKNSTVEVEAAR